MTADLGGDPVELLASVGLPAHAIYLDDLLLPTAAYGALLEITAVRLECPGLGLRVARLQSPTVLGPLAIAIANSPTIGESLACLTRYMYLHSSSTSIRLDEDPDGDADVVALYYSPDEPREQRQATDLGVGFIHRGLTYLARGHYGLRSVDLPYTPPAPAHVYRSFFGAPVRTRLASPAAVLRIPASLPTTPLRDVDKTMQQLALAFLARQTATRGADIAARVRTAVAESLGTTTVDITAVARLMSVHPRTLQRQLRARGTSYGEVLDRVRRDKALSLLTGTDLPLGHVAAMTGFTEHASFTRAARRWWDAPPSQVRTRADEQPRPAVL
ncbi:AraC family transcriptional regulator [Nocardioides lijunqiniae]|uniref:AraC family transcriptional regulator n=1 Tax=Nocardioides lijunqiniae TaxID=2760832 RepID=UPI0030B84FA0